MKPAIGYGIAGGPYASDWEIITITSEKTGPRGGMVYGRDERGATTHHKPSDVHGRFASLEVAQIAQEALRKLHTQYRPLVHAAEVELQRVQLARLNAMRRALENIRVDQVVA